MRRVRAQESAETFFLREQNQRRTQLALAGANAGAGRCAPKRSKHPAHHAPSTCSPQPTTLPSACDIQPIAPKRLQALASVPQAPSDSIPPYASHPPFATHRASLHTWFPTQLHAMQPGSAQFSTQRPERLQLPAHRTPSVRNIRPTAPQAPAASGSSFVTQRASLHTWFPTQLCAMQPSSARFPTQRPRHLRHAKRAAPRPCGFPHSAPGICDMLNAMLPRSCDSPRSTPSARYLFDATLSSSQVHRKAKATRTRAPPA